MDSKLGTRINNFSINVTPPPRGHKCDVPFIIFHYTQVEAFLGTITINTHSENKTRDIMSKPYVYNACKYVLTSPSEYGKHHTYSTSLFRRLFLITGRRGLDFPIPIMASHSSLLHLHPGPVCLATSHPTRGFIPELARPHCQSTAEPT